MAKTRKKKASAKPKMTTRSPEQKMSCELVRAEVEEQLEAKCKAKVNRLRQCNSCELSPQDQNLPIIGSFGDVKKLNTAFDGSGGSLPVGSRDSLWEVGEGTPSSMPTTWSPAFVVGQVAGSWATSPFSNAEWISFYNNGGHSNNVDIYYRARFILGNGINPSSFKLGLDFFADNAVYEIYVNGAAQSGNLADVPPPTPPYTYEGFKTGNRIQAELSHDWQPCVNEIIVHIKSGGPYQGFLLQNAAQCETIEIPDLEPDFSVVWGDSECDCFETNDLETVCITACNHYCNIGFENLTISKVSVVDHSGHPVPNLPDGSPSIEVLPYGPICFGDLGPCIDNTPVCKTRQVAIRTCGAVAGKYKLRLEVICFEIAYTGITKSCFEFKLCKD